MSQLNLPDDFYTFDFEVFLYDWLVIFKNYKTKEYTIIHNDVEALEDFISRDPLLGGFNCKGYDNYMLKGLLLGLTSTELKELSDWIIEENKKEDKGEKSEPWNHPYLKRGWAPFIRSIDITNDMQQMSLKAFEGHYGLNIQETEVDFNIQRPLTQKEIQLTIKYCTWDVDSTETLFDLRADYLNTKAELGAMKDIPLDVALRCTNAQIVAKYMGAVRHDYNDAREFIIPDVLDKSVIPKEVLDYFNRTNDLSIPDSVIFGTRLNIKIGTCPCVYSAGGVHGSEKKYHAVTTPTIVIRNRDVSSLYPSILLVYELLSRNVQDPAVFAETYWTRINAKKGIGDVSKAKLFKLPLNTISGAMEAKFNDLYDPHNARSMRYIGQLLITEIVIKLINAIPSFKLINLNTDGFMYEIDVNDLAIADELCKAWEEKTQLVLEEDKIQEVWIKDVNNLIILMESGKVKKVGNYVNWGISNKGKFAINNNYIIVKKAVLAYLTENIPIEKTIYDCNDLKEFQIIAKAGSKYSRAFQLVDDEEVPIQKVNRVYATNDTSLGTLKKFGGKRQNTSKISDVPENAIIDNDNHLSIDDINKDWYIALAKRKVNDFIGSSKRKKAKNKEEIMATKKESVVLEETTKIAEPDYSAMSIYQKVQEVRTKLLSEVLKKNGVNAHMEYTYFELGDFLPILTPLMAKVGLTSTISYTKEEAKLVIYNTQKLIDNGEVKEPESMTWLVPMPPMSALISNTGKKMVSDVQAIGMTMTYMRRYLYITAFDIVESDGIEDTAKQIDKSQQDQAVATKKEAKVDTPAPTPTPKPVETPKPVVKQPKGNAPLNSVERKETVKEIVNKEKDKESETPVTNVSLAETLKGNLKKVLTVKPEASSKIQAILMGIKSRGGDIRKSITQEQFDYGMSEIEKIMKGDK